LTRVRNRLIDVLTNAVAARLAEQSPAVPLAEAVPVVESVPAPEAASTSVGHGAIQLDYPPTPRVRYGYGKPPHKELAALFDSGEETFRARLSSFALLRDHLIDIPIHAIAADSTEPCWVNDWLPALDSLAIYGFLAQRSPARYVEVGSGNSTKFARRSIRDHSLKTIVMSIDPVPRAEIDAICDTVIRSPLEDADLTVFETLEPGDVVFIDNSHRSFQNSDVTVFFLDVLPKIPSGVLVGIHDVCLPFDYPDEWLPRYYSEQYLLAAFLLGGHVGFDIVLPSFYCSLARHTTSDLDAVWDEPYFSPIQRHGAAFWMQRT
jgi:hypothetical protein